MAERVTVHVVLDGLPRHDAAGIVRDLLYYLERDTTNYEGESPGYAGFFPAEGYKDRSPVTAMREAFVQIDAEVQRQVKNGEEYSWQRESMFGPAVMGTITSKRGDLCDMRDAIERQFPWSIKQLIGRRRETIHRGDGSNG